MQVRNKLFPYPVINHNAVFSNFKDLDFFMEFEPLETEAAYILKNVHFVTDSQTINQLYEEGKIEITMIVECSDTVYRRGYEVGRESKDIILPKVDFTEKVDISMFATAKKPFKLSSNELEEDYQGLEFDIDQYDILGAYDGFNVRFKHEEAEETLVQSIFAINVDHDLEEGKYVVECNIGRKISITLSEKDYLNYKVIYTVPTYKEVFFNMLLVPSLIEGLSLCKQVLNDETKDLDDVGNQYLWFRSIQTAYKRLKGIDLTTDEFSKMSPVTLAQDLLGKPIGESLSKLVNETNKIDIGGSENA